MSERFVFLADHIVEIPFNLRRDIVELGLKKFSN